MPQAKKPREQKYYLRGKIKPHKIVRFDKKELMRPPGFQLEFRKDNRGEWKPTRRNADYKEFYRFLEEEKGIVIEKSERWRNPDGTGDEALWLKRKSGGGILSPEEFFGLLNEFNKIVKNKKRTND